MKKLVVGILAHVDAGKTTLSEGLLYETGVIRKRGRVDTKDAYLDNDSVERERGITIYSKVAKIPLKDTELILIDTPGHIDFSTEMERSLSVMDVAILLISGSSGVQPHTKTLWNLLRYYNIPTFIFVNKMDMPDTSHDVLLATIRKFLSNNAVDFNINDEDRFEEIATCDEKLLNIYLETGEINDELIKKAIVDRNLYPVFFGSALKMTGINEFIEGLNRFLPDSEYGKYQNDEFSARVYKIIHDSMNKRITFMKILSGSLKVKDMLGDEKVNEIRMYSGEKYEMVKEAFAGDICVKSYMFLP